MAADAPVVLRERRQLPDLPPLHLVVRVVAALKAVLGQVPVLRSDETGVRQARRTASGQPLYPAFA